MYSKVFFTMWHELNRCYWIEQMTANSKAMYEAIAKAYCDAIKVTYDSDAMNEKTWVARDVVRAYMEVRKEQIL